VQLLPEDPGVVPTNLVRFLIDIEMPRYVITIGTVVRDENFDLLRSKLLEVSGVFPMCRMVRLALLFRCTWMVDVSVGL